MKTAANRNEFIEITFNEKTKKNQGDATSASTNSLHNDHHIISALPGCDLCPVNSFKHYLSLLNKNQLAFFQYPTKDRRGFTSMVIGKNSPGSMMSEIAKSAELSRNYTNHQIRKTTATAMYHQGFDLHEISHVTKHKNLDSLKYYVAGPMHSDKERYNQGLFSYAQNDENQDKRKQQTPQEPEATSKTKRVKTKQISNVENVEKDNCIVLMYPHSETEDEPPSNLQSFRQNST